MKYAREFVVSAIVGGLFVIVPVYLAALLPDSGRGTLLDGPK